MTLALLAALALAVPSPPSHLRYPAAARPAGGVVALGVGVSGHGYARPTRPRGDAFSPALLDSDPGVVRPPFRYAPDAEPPQALEAAFLGAGRVYRLRVVTTVNGQPAGAAWAATVARLFAAFDRDGDGYLNRHEFEQVFSLPGLKELAEGQLYTQAYAVPSLREADRDGDRRVSLDELQFLYRDAPADFLRTRPRPANDESADRVTEAVLASLDVNGDGRLSEAELRDAARLLLTLDADDDECLSQSEFPVNYGAKAGSGMMAAGAGMMGADQGVKAADAPPGDLVVKLGELPGDTSKRILARYDADKDGVLSGDEIPFDAATAKALDGDGDGKLTLTELYAYGKRPPDVVVTVDQGPTAATCRVTATGFGGGPLPAGLSLRRAEPGRVILRSGATVLDFSATPADTRATRARFDRLLATLPGGETLTEGALTGPAHQFLRVTFDAADRDGDGRLTRGELVAYFELQLAVAGLAQTVSTTVSRPNLFQLLDDNRDGKLSVRELRTAWERLIVLEPAGARYVTRAVLQPAASFRVSSAAADFAVPAPENSPQAAPAAGVPEGRGPLWFRKMDRNGDGDVSRAEFLGDAADFARLDADGDGLISLDEAIAAEKPAAKVAEKPAAKPKTK